MSNQNGLKFRNIKTSAGKDMEQLELPFIVGANTKCAAALQINCHFFLFKKKTQKVTV